MKNFQGCNVYPQYCKCCHNWIGCTEHVKFGISCNQCGHSKSLHQNGGFMDY